MSKQDHDFYVSKLARHERQRSEDRVVFTEFTLGPVWIRRKHPGRADVASLKVSWRSWLFNIFEVKATRSDFLRDIRSDKWRKYLPHCTRFYFAAPDGVIKSTELADEAGLMVYKSDKDAWHTVRHPKRKNMDDPTADILRAMVFYLWGTEHPTEERARRIQHIYAETRKSGKSLSNLLSMLGNRHVRQLQRHIDQLETDKKKVDYQQRAQFNALKEYGLPCDPWELRRELRQRQHQLDELEKRLVANEEKYD